MNSVGVTKGPRWIQIYPQAVAVTFCDLHDLPASLHIMTRVLEDQKGAFVFL